MVAGTGRGLCGDGGWVQFAGYQLAGWARKRLSSLTVASHDAPGSIAGRTPRVVVPVIPSSSRQRPHGEPLLDRRARAVGSRTTRRTAPFPMAWTISIRPGVSRRFCKQWGRTARHEGHAVGRQTKHRVTGLLAYIGDPTPPHEDHRHPGPDVMQGHGQDQTREPERLCCMRDCSWHDVVVLPEEVGRVVAALDGDQPVPIGPVACCDPVRPVDPVDRVEVEKGAVQAVRFGRRVQPARPGDGCLIVGRIVRGTDDEQLVARLAVREGRCRWPRPGSSVRRRTRSSRSATAGAARPRVR